MSKTTQLAVTFFEGTAVLYTPLGDRGLHGQSLE